MLLIETIVSLVWDMVNVSLSHFLICQTVSKLTTSIRRRMVLQIVRNRGFHDSNFWIEFPFFQECRKKALLSQKVTILSWNGANFHAEMFAL